MRLRLIAFSLFLVGCPNKAITTEDASTATATTDAGAPADAATATATRVVDAAAAPTHSGATTTAGKTIAPPAPPPATSSKGAAKAATYTCKAGEVDNGEACFKACTKDADCAKSAKCQPMMIGNPNGGTSTAMTCQKP